MKLLTSILLFTLCSFTQAGGPKDAQLFAKLEQMKGIYNLAENRGCDFDSALVDADKPFEIEVLVIENDDEFGRSQGDIEVRLVQGNLRAFDRSSFFNINQGVDRSLVGTSVISRKSLLSESGDHLSHKVATYTPGFGGTYSRQDLRWTEDFGSFSYDYILGKISSFGISTDDEQTRRTCIFERAK